MTHQFRVAIGAVAVVLSAAACTISTDRSNVRRAARVVPDATALSKWLEQSPRQDGGPSRFFVVMADTQLGMSEYPLPLLLMGATYRDHRFEKDARLYESAVSAVNELAPAFVVICGDLVNRVGHAGQIARFKRISATLKQSIPLYLVAGNHDVGNDPTTEALDSYRDEYGPDWYSFQTGGVYGIVLNSQIIDSPGHVQEEAEKQLAWTREELKRARASDAAHILVFQHQSLFLKAADEDDEYFNVEREARAVYLNLFKEAGVEAVFAGHLHRNAYGRDGSLEMITTGPVGRPLGDDPSGFRVVEVLENSLRHEYFALDP